ncbi:MAG: hypothetical protein UMR38_01890 [Candidatus Izemoplasma sp.]|nr:hypothetical protein [Candidatus Izemoplasma sp.]
MLDYVEVTDWSIFNKHIAEKGFGIVREVVESLKVVKESDYIISDEVIGFIRYDKYLREKLYMYLSVTEEFLRNELYKNLEYKGSKLIMYTSDYKYQDFKFIQNPDYGYSFFKRSKMLFSVILDLFEHFAPNILPEFDFTIDDIKNVGKLRNIVMHHSLLMIDQNSTKTTKKSIEERVDLITRYLTSLINIIPVEYRKGLITDINKANLDNGIYGSKSKHIYIDHIQGGYDNGV